MWMVLMLFVKFWSYLSQDTTPCGLWPGNFLNSLLLWLCWFEAWQPHESTKLQFTSKTVIIRFFLSLTIKSVTAGPAEEKEEVQFVKDYDMELAVVSWVHRDFMNWFSLRKLVAIGKVTEQADKISSRLVTFTTATSLALSLFLPPRRVAYGSVIYHMNNFTGRK